MCSFIFPRALLPNNVQCRTTPESVCCLSRVFYEDFCFEDSFLGNRVKTCMDELSFISAVASCKNETVRILIFSPEQSKFFKGTNGVGAL